MISGKLIIGVGLALIVVGLVFLGMEKLTGGRGLPGDIHVEGRRWSFSFPIVTCIVISIVATVLLNLFMGKR